MSENQTFLVEIPRPDSESESAFQYQIHCFCKLHALCIGWSHDTDKWIYLICRKHTKLRKIETETQYQIFLHLYWTEPRETWGQSFSSLSWHHGLQIRRFSWKRRWVVDPENGTIVETKLYQKQTWVKYFSKIVI